MNYLSKSKNDTIKFGRRLARLLEKGDIVCLFGDLGTGKTTLTKGIARGLKIKAAEIVSPTFVLLNIYKGRLPLYHFDFYRMENTSQIRELGYEEYFFGEGVSVIEWAQRLGELLPKDYLKVRMLFKDNHTRLITISGCGRRPREIAKKIVK